MCLSAYEVVQEEKTAIYYLYQRTLDHQRGERQMTGSEDGLTFTPTVTLDSHACFFNNSNVFMALVKPHPLILS